MKVLILTDSLSLPRKTVAYENTYPYLLKEKFTDIEFVSVGIGGGTIFELYKQLNYYIHFKPSIIILQSGIVDCAPRPFSKQESKVIQRLRLRRVLNPFVNFIRNKRNFTYSSKSVFLNYCNLINKRAKEADASVYSLGIIPAAMAYEKMLPNISANIVSYNAILKNSFHFISNNDFDLEKEMLEDFHHMNSLGHKNIFRKIDKILLEVINA